MRKSRRGKEGRVREPKGGGWRGRQGASAGTRLTAGQGASTAWQAQHGRQHRGALTSSWGGAADQGGEGGGRVSRAMGRAAGPPNIITPCIDTHAPGSCVHTSSSCSWWHAGGGARSTCGACEGAGSGSCAGVLPTLGPNRHLPSCQEWPAAKGSGSGGKGGKWGQGQSGTAAADRGEPSAGAQGRRGPWVQGRRGPWVPAPARCSSAGVPLTLVPIHHCAGRVVPGAGGKHGRAQQARAGEDRA